MGAGLFWGILLILIGLGIVIRVVFNINFPVVKFVIAFFFILIGIKILFGSFNFWHCNSGGDTTIFSESNIDGQKEEFKEYNVIFGSSVIDLRNIDLTEGSKEIVINSIFGSTVLKIDKETPVKIKSDVVFASSKMPNEEVSAFGNGRYESDNFNRDTNHVYIKADIVFGELKLKVY
ncbi:MAG: LiaF-related protein [Bacteroidales bacterium]|nr:LiaF-related protein [Bacteroidales bacterium]